MNDDERDDEKPSMADSPHFAYLRDGRSAHPPIESDDEHEAKRRLYRKIAVRTAAGFVGCLILLALGVHPFAVLTLFVIATCVMLLTM